MKRYYQREYVVYFNKEALFLFHAFVNITKTLKVHGVFINIHECTGTCICFAEAFEHFTFDFFLKRTH